MCGEIGVDIRNISIRKFEDNNYEMTFNGKDGSFLHIIGDNDLKTLLLEAIENIKQVNYKNIRIID